MGCGRTGDGSHGGTVVAVRGTDAAGMLRRVVGVRRGRPDAPCPIDRGVRSSRRRIVALRAQVRRKPEPVGGIHHRGIVVGILFRLRHVALSRGRLYPVGDRCVFRDDVGIHDHRCHHTRRYRTPASWHPVLAQPHAVDRRIRHRVLHHRIAARFWWWRTAVVPVGSYRRDPRQDPSQN